MLRNTGSPLTTHGMIQVVLHLLSLHEARTSCAQQGAASLRKTHALYCSAPLTASLWLQRRAVTTPPLIGDAKGSPYSIDTQTAAIHSSHSNYIAVLLFLYAVGAAP